MITKETLIGEINAIEFHNYHNSDDPRHKGEVEISCIKFAPNENTCDVINENDQKGTRMEFFLIVLICGNKVLASKVLTADEKGSIQIDRSFNFKELASDFEISLALYSMLAKEKSHISSVSF